MSEYWDKQDAEARELARASRTREAERVAAKAERDAQVAREFAKACERDYREELESMAMEIADLKGDIEHARAAIHAATIAYEFKHGPHLGGPRMSGLNGEGHAPCIWCILAGYNSREFSVKDYENAVEGMTQAMAERNS